MIMLIAAVDRYDDNIWREYAMIDNNFAKTK